MGVYLADNFARYFYLFQRRAKADIKGVYLSGDIAHNKKTFFIKIPRRKTGDFFSIKDGKCGKRRLFFRRAYDCKCRAELGISEAKKISPIKYRREKDKFKNCGVRQNGK